MVELWKKLNHTGQDPVVILNAPADFGPVMHVLAERTTVHQRASAVKRCAFALCFATQQQEVDAHIKALDVKLEGDAILWMAYPKGSSKKYRCAFNRDTGWTELGKAGFEPVRQVAIDADWSALRFRRVGFIKKMTRSFAMTAEGKAKAERGR